MFKVVLWLIAVVAGLFSLYGWWFHFSVGPSHGPGAELGVFTGAVALIVGSHAVRLHRRDRRLGL